MYMCRNVETGGKHPCAAQLSLSSAAGIQPLELNPVKRSRPLPGLARGVRASVDAHVTVADRDDVNIAVRR